MLKLSRSLVAVALVAGLGLTVAPAFAGGAEDDAGDAIEQYMDAAFDGDWAKTYAMLPSGQSDLLTEAEWADCQDERNGHLVGAQLEELDVVRSKQRKRYRLPGTDERVNALAVTIEVTASLGGQTQTDRDTVFVVKQGKRWRPSVRQSHIDACLAGSSLT